MSVIYDRDPDDETTVPEPSPSNGMCTRCRENEALPTDDWCGGCIEDWTFAMGLEDEDDG